MKSILNRKQLALKTNEAGFTLLESLLALMLSSVTLLVLTATISQLQQMSHLIIQDAQIVATAKSTIYGSRQVEWHLFLAQLENYLQDTKLIESKSYEFTVRENMDGKDQYVRYAQARSGNHNFYRQNNNGYNELLTNIKKMRLDVSGDCLSLVCEFRNGELYEGSIWINDWHEKK